MALSLEFATLARPTGEGNAIGDGGVVALLTLAAGALRP